MKFVDSYHITVFTHEDAAAAIIAAVRDVVELSYGKYAGVSWSSAPGKERYTPLLGSNAKHGTIGNESSVDSVRLEFSIPREEALLRAVVQDGIFMKHGWEVPVTRVTEGWDIIKDV